MKIVLFDTETTGFPKMPIEKQPLDMQPRITQIYAAQLEYDSNGDYEVVKVLKTNVKGAKFIPKKITQLTGITMDSLKDAPYWLQTRDEFFGMCLDAGMVAAHNVQFDCRMVHAEEHQLAFEKPFEAIKRRCTLEASRRINKDAASHSIGNIYKHLFKEELKDAHTAEADVNGLIRLYMDLYKKKAWE